MGPIALNARFQVHRTTGMQRYALEVSRRAGRNLDPVRPRRDLRGIAGHMWEQFYLPTAVKGRLLWSPNNTGPLAVPRHVCTIHDLIPLDRPEWFSPKFSSWYGWLMPRLAKRLSHVITVSEFTKWRVMDLLGVPETRITVILNGVDQRFRPMPAESIKRICGKFGVAPGSYILSVGSLEPRKNLHRLLEAWRRLHSQTTEETSLVIVGSESNARVFQGVHLGELPPRVRFTGYVDDEDLPALYSGALAFVYPSLYEGFGLPPLEAMACGALVVTSSGTSIDEVVGDSAILVDPYDVDSIADGMLRAISENGRLDRMRDEGQARARRLTWDRTADETLRVLLEQASL